MSCIIHSPWRTLSTFSHSNPSPPSIRRDHLYKPHFTPRYNNGAWQKARNSVPLVPTTQRAPSLLEEPSVPSQRSAVGHGTVLAHPQGHHGKVRRIHTVKRVKATRMYNAPMIPTSSACFESSSAVESSLNRSWIHLVDLTTPGNRMSWTPDARSASPVMSEGSP
jgi:hypothetical protein